MVTTLLNERQRSRDNHQGGEEMERLVILPAAILMGHLLLAAAG
jgi:hypothetical protein